MLVKKEFTILTQGIQYWVPRTHPPYPPEYRQQIVELALAGRSPIELAREFEPSEQTIRDWIKQAEIDTDPVRFTTQSARDCAVLGAGRRPDGTPAGYGGTRSQPLSGTLVAPDRVVKSWRACAARTSSSALSGRSWQKQRPGSHGRPTRSRPGLRVREGEPGTLSCRHTCRAPTVRGDMSPAGGLHQRLLRVAETWSFATDAPGCTADRAHPGRTHAFAGHIWCAAYSSRPCRARQGCRVV